MGKLLQLKPYNTARNVGDYEIRGIVKNTHPKTHFKYEMLLSQKGGLQERFEQQPNRKTQWVYNYFKLRKELHLTAVAEKVTAFLRCQQFETNTWPTRICILFNAN